MKKQIIAGALALSTVIAIPAAMAKVAAPVAKATPPGVAKPDVIFGGIFGVTAVIILL